MTNTANLANTYSFFERPIPITIPIFRTIPVGPWYCTECTQLFDQYDVKDPSIDLDLIEYLRTGKVLDDFEEVDRLNLTDRAQ